VIDVGDIRYPYWKLNTNCYFNPMTLQNSLGIMIMNLFSWTSQWSDFYVNLVLKKSFFLNDTDKRRSKNFPYSINFFYHITTVKGHQHPLILGIYLIITIFFQCNQSLSSITGSFSTKPFLWTVSRLYHVRYIQKWLNTG
jgi:hypothetical protein